MGKMKLKLSHVMPHAWFYKLREVGKPGAKHFKPSDPARDRGVFGSTVNHKAMDIAFPTETVKRSPYIQHVPEEAIDIECQPSVVIPYVLAPENTMSFSLEEDDSDKMLPTSDSNGSVNFDIRELEKRLKALATEDGRRSLSSPMLLSVALSSPMRSGGAPHTQCMLKGLNKAASDSWDQHGGSSGAFVSNQVHLDMLDKCRGPRNSPLLNVSHPNGEWQPSESCASNAGGRHSYGSTDDSNRHSTSSSDTGLERASSSIWERDAFSITSDGSEAFATMTCPESADLVHKAMVRPWRMRENRSPCLHQNAIVDNGMPGFRVPEQHLGSPEKDLMHGLFRNGHASSSEHTSRHRISISSQKGSNTGEILASSLDQSICITRVGNADRNERDSHSKIQVPLLPRTACQQEEGDASSSNSNFESSMLRGTHASPGCSKKLDSISLPDNPESCVLVQDKIGVDRLGVQSRHSAGPFSYARCKEKLLSSKILTRQGGTEEQRLSNYAKFKLRQRTLTQNKLNVSNGSMQCDLGHSNTTLRRDEHPHSDDRNATISAHSDSNPSTLDYGTRECVSSHRRSTSSYHSVSPRDLKNSKGIAQDEGPSGLLGALKPVRQKPISLSSEQSSSATTGGTCSTTSQSRVFDSFAMVKFSYNPSQDFKESMVEMVLEKGLQSSHDMVELLQCYLTLNADVYHNTIVNVFTEVWSEMFRQRSYSHHS